MSTAALAPTTITMNIAGTLATSSIVTMAMPFAGKITGAYVAVTTAPAGSALAADLKVGSGVAAAFSIADAGTSDAGALNTASYAVTNKDKRKRIFCSLVWWNCCFEQHSSICSRRPCKS